MGTCVQGGTCESQQLGTEMREVQILCSLPVAPTITSTSPLVAPHVSLKSVHSRLLLTPAAAHPA